MAASRYAPIEITNQSGTHLSCDRNAQVARESMKSAANPARLRSYAPTAFGTGGNTIESYVHGSTKPLALIERTGVYRL